MKNLNSKKSRNSVAMLINEISVASIMIESAKLEENEASVLLWRISKCEGIIELADVWGIELPGLDISRAVLPELETRYTNK